MCGQPYHEAGCTNSEVTDYLNEKNGVSAAEHTVILDRPCKLYKKQRRKQ